MGICVAALAVGYANADGIRLPSLRSKPEPVALPMLPAIPDRFEGIPLESYLEGVVPMSQRDALLSSAVLRDPDFARRVHWWVRYWTVTANRWFPDFLTRMAWLGGTVDSALTEGGFPPSLRYLPLIESGYNPSVTSHASAVGLWQLMAPTARGLGLEVSTLLDERRNPERSTAAALAYLDDLHDEFDSWFITLAAYNSGPTRVRRILRRHAPDAPRTDSLYWALRRHFPSETREFLPKLFGAMWVASRPEAYGYAIPAVEPFVYDSVWVPDQTTLDVVARAADVPYEEIIRLNPELVRRITLPGREMPLRVPAGQGPTFAYHYALILPSERVTFVEHVVSAGETLSRIAGRYGARVSDIEAANPTVRARNLPVGVRLTIPVAPSLRQEPVS